MPAPCGKREIRRVLARTMTEGKESSPNTGNIAYSYTLQPPTRLTTSAELSASETFQSGFSPPCPAPRRLSRPRSLERPVLHRRRHRLTPLFKGEGHGKVYARYAAGEAIAGYHPNSRADYATIGRILALSLATITAAEHASNHDLPTNDLVRVLGKVHTLSQAADRAERSMMTRRKQMQEDGVHRDALVPRPSGRPSRYAPLPVEDPASGAAREAEEQAAQVETVASEPDRAVAEDHPAPATTQNGPPAAKIKANDRQPEAQPVAPAKTGGLRMPETVPAAVLTALQSGHKPAAMATSRPGFPAMPSGENAAFAPVTAKASFRQHLLGSGATLSADQSQHSND